MSITFILLCVGAYLLFFLLRRWEAKEKSSRWTLQLVVDWCDWLLCVSGTCQEVCWKAKKRYNAG